MTDHERRQVAMPYFFFHVPKTGGTSVVESAVAAMGKGNVFIYVESDQKKLVLRIRQMLDAQKPFPFMTGHVSPIHIPLDIPMKRAIMLRDPLERLISNFCWFYKYRNWGKHGETFFSSQRRIGQANFSAADLAEWIETFGWDNMQVRVIAGLPGLMSGRPGRPVEENDVTTCCNILDSMDLIGTTNNLAAFLDRMGNEIWGQPFDVRRENESKRTILRLTEPDCRELQRKYLDKDKILYEYAIGLLEKKSRLPDIYSVRIPRRSGLAGWLHVIRHQSFFEFIRPFRLRAGIVLRAARVTMRSSLKRIRGAFSRSALQ